MRGIRKYVVAAGAAALIAAPTAPASASAGDVPCRITGPAYVSGAIDCVNKIVYIVLSTLPPIG